MKSIIALFLIAFVGFAFSQSQVVDPGYKSSQLSVEDGDTGYFQIPITGNNGDYCNPNNVTDVICGVEIIYDKHLSGEQRICVGWTMLTECTAESPDYVETLGVEDSFTVTYYAEYEGGMDYSGNLYLTIGGKCKTSDLCFETTDGDVESVRIYEADGVSNAGDVTSPTTGSMNYVPFEMDSDGSNTAMYTVTLAESDDFAYPSMTFDIATGGDDHYIVLDIDEVNDISYSVEFHYTDGGICGDSTAANSTLCNWNSTMNYVYPANDDGGTPVRGDYATGPISLGSGSWGVTPYMYSDNIQSSIDFRFCGSVGYECASASGLAPSIAFFVTLLLAIIAYLF
jgi:hypothetical protein